MTEIQTLVIERIRDEFSGNGKVLELLGIEQEEDFLIFRLLALIPDTSEIYQELLKEKRALHVKKKAGHTQAESESDAIIADLDTKIVEKP